MIEITPVADSNILEMTFSGSVTAEEFDAALATFDAAIKQHGSIRVLENIGELDMPPIPLSRVWDDVKFGFEHLADISHVAVVADQGWIAAWIKVLGPLLRLDVKMFKSTELDAARAWLRSAA